MNHFRSKCMQLVVDMFKGSWRPALASVLEFVLVLACTAMATTVANAQTFVLQQILNDPNPARGARFGNAVAINGNKVLIGVPFNDTNGDSAGQVFLFDATTGNLLQTFNDPNPAPGDAFGTVVAISGDNVLISAPADDTNGEDAGQAFLFDATTGNLLQTFNDPNPAPGDRFGGHFTAFINWPENTVAISGDNVLIGAPADDTNGEDAGQAFLFDAATGNLLQTFNDPNPAPGDAFGFAVAISGDNILIGAPTDDKSSLNAVGQAFLFDAITGNLIRTFNDPNPARGARFGNAVAINGNKILIGTPNWCCEGQAFLFDAITGDLLQTFNNQIASGQNGFARAVAISGNNILIGDHIRGGGDQEGGTFLFDATTGNLLQNFNDPNLHFFGPEEFGFAVAISGDNVLISDPSDSTNGTNGFRLGQAVLFSFFTIGEVPNLTGMAQDVAEEVLIEVGLVGGTITSQPSTTVAIGSVISQSVEPGSQVDPGTAIDLVLASGTVVPNVEGLAQSEAAAAIVASGLVVGMVTTERSTTVDAGDIISQSVTPASQVDPGTTVDLVISSGPPPVTVPDVTGLPQAEAEAAVAAAGLVVGTVTTQNSTTVNPGNVISQNPAAGSQHPSGTAINLVVSSGPPSIPVNNGDINGDEKITPADALLGFQHFLGLADLSVAQQAVADVNQDGMITPADALCIFQQFLGLPSCLN